MLAIANFCSSLIACLLVVSFLLNTGMQITYHTVKKLWQYKSLAKRTLANVDLHHQSPIIDQQ